MKRKYGVRHSSVAFNLRRYMEASGDGATAMGPGSVASAPGSVAIGAGARATAPGSMALGAGAEAKEEGVLVAAGRIIAAGCCTSHCMLMM